jgi:hypothetical protein
VYAEVKILTMLLNMSGIHRIHVWSAFMKNKVIGPFYFEEPTMTGDTILIMMENKGTVSQSYGA